MIRTIAAALAAFALVAFSASAEETKPADTSAKPDTKASTKPAKKSKKMKKAKKAAEPSSTTATPSK